MFQGQQGGGDRLSQMQEGDQRQQALDMQQRQSLFDQLHQLYGMSQSSQMMPANLAHMGAETNYLNAQGQHLGSEDTRANQLMPAQLAHYTGEESRANTMLPAQLQHLGAESGYLGAQTSHLGSEDTRADQLLPGQIALGNAQTAHFTGEESRGAQMFPDQQAKMRAETGRDEALTASVGPHSLNHIQAMGQMEQLGYFPPGTTQAFARLNVPGLGAFMDQAKAKENDTHWNNYVDQAKQGGISEQLRPQVSREFGDTNLGYLDTLGTQDRPPGMTLTPEQLQNPEIQAQLKEYHLQHQKQHAQDDGSAALIDQLKSINHPLGHLLSHFLTTLPFTAGAGSQIGNSFHYTKPQPTENPVLTQLGF